jgi:16S rRNA (cytosine1402-N4)-methyltransferase
MSTTLLEMRVSRQGARGRRAGSRAASRAGAGPRSGRHVPVLASELIELLDPQPGQSAIDCTFGDGGHARLVAERLGPSGTLVAIDRDPLAERRFNELASGLPCAARFIRGAYVEAL